MLTVLSIVTIFAPIISLPIVFVAMLSEKTLKKKIIYGAILGLIISYVMYNFCPNEMDLSRYYNIMETYRDLNINSFLEIASNGIEPIMNTLFYIFAKTNDSHLITLFVSLVSYLIQLYILYDYQKEKPLSRWQSNILLIFFFSSFLLISHMTLLRFCLARMIFLLALYLDLYKKKKNIFVILLYIIPLFIHQSAIILILLRILLSLNKYKYNIKTIILFIALLIAPDAIISIAEKFSENFSFFSMLGERAKHYLNTGNDFATIYIFQLLLVAIIMLITAIIKRKKISSNDKLLNYNLMVSSLSLVYINNYDISSRLLSFSISLSIPVLIDAMKYFNEKSKTIVYVVLIIFSTIFAIFQGIQLQFGEYNNLFMVNENILMVFVFVISILIYISKKNAGGNNNG